jgi:hypothetical protein
MNDRQARARQRMMGFVATMFVVTCAPLAAFYGLVIHPGEPKGQPSPHAIDQSQ